MELSFNPVNVPTVWSLHFVARKCFDKLGTMLLKPESIIDPHHAEQRGWITAMAAGDQLALGKLYDATLGKFTAWRCVLPARQNVPRKSQVTSIYRRIEMPRALMPNAG